MFKFLPFLFLLFLSTSQVNGEKVEDPFIWLEEEESIQKTQWLEKQQHLSSKYFQNDTMRQQIRERLQTLLDFDTYDIPRQYGSGIFYLSRPKKHSQTCLFRLDENEHKYLILDPRTTLQNDRPISIVGYAVQEKGSLVAYGQSLFGSDWHQWRIVNFLTGEELPDILEGIKFNPPVWDHEGKGLYYFKFEENAQENTLTTKQQLYYHQLGTPSSEDKKLFTQRAEGLLYFSLAISCDGRYLLFSEAAGAGANNGILFADLQADPLEFKELIPLKEFKYNYIGFLENRLFFITDENAPKGKIISIDPTKPENANWLTHIPESNNLLENGSLVDKFIIAAFLKNAHSEVKIFDLEGNEKHTLILPGKGTVALPKITQSNENSKQFFYAYTSYNQPTTVYQTHIETGLSEPFAVPKSSANPENYLIEQHFYPSGDGTLVPIFVLHKKNLSFQGKQPTLLYGYGGFNISLTPAFDAKIITWLDMGGVYAIANIRGGGEYGRAWHQAGKHQNKQNCFNDFIAAAEWLCSHHYTNPSKLAINGRSNGGLLVGAAMTQRPDLFRAAMVDVGVLDMLKFHKYTIGWAWMQEYGSPDNPKDFALLYAYSPYHNVKKGIKYPATLITTADHDNRVVPQHSYKFAAALQEAQEGDYPIILKVYKNAGHGQGKSLDQKIEEDVDHLYFIMKELQSDE